MKDFIVDNKTLYNFQYKLLTYFSHVVRVSLALYIIGVTNAKSETVLTINFYVKLFLGFFLVYRFGSRRVNAIKFTDLDRKIAYSAGLYIIVLSFSDLLASITEITRSHVIKFLEPIKNALIAHKNRFSLS